VAARGACAAADAGDRTARWQVARCADEPVAQFRQGLKDTGYVEGDNLTIAYRWAKNVLDRVPELAGELVRRRVAVIVATGGLAPAKYLHTAKIKP
jgi:ABC-type uncharacterized transport system substrate-binding protein